MNARIKDSTETRTVFTNQWLDENGATAFLRASQSSDLVVMRLLLAHGADPKIATIGDVTALQVAAGIGWVDGLTYEWSDKANVEAVKLLLELGIDPNIQAITARLHGAGHKSRTAVIQMLVDAGAKLDARDFSDRERRRWQTRSSRRQPFYADGLVRVGVQSPSRTLMRACFPADDRAGLGSTAHGPHTRVGLHYRNLRRPRGRATGTTSRPAITTTA